MVYLIGGPPRCGKTTVARRLAQRLGCSWVPIDYLESVVYHYLPAGDRDRVLPVLDGSYETVYATYTPDQIIEHYKQRARTMWPAIQVFLHFALAQEHDFILEGFHIEPALMQEFRPAGGQGGDSTTYSSAHIAEMVRRGTAYALGHGGDDRIKTIFLYREDIAAITAGIHQRSDTREWVLQETNQAATAHRIAEMVRTYSCYIRAEAARLGLTAFTMDGDFDRRVGETVAWLEAIP